MSSHVFKLREDFSGFALVRGEKLVEKYLGESFLTDKRPLQEDPTGWNIWQAVTRDSHPSVRNSSGILLSREVISPLNCEFIPWFPCHSWVSYNETCNSTPLYYNYSVDFVNQIVQWDKNGKKYLKVQKDKALVAARIGYVTIFSCPPPVFG